MNTIDSLHHQIVKLDTISALLMSSNDDSINPEGISTLLQDIIDDLKETKETLKAELNVQ